MTLSAILQIIAGCAFLAMFPATAWGYIFYKKQREDRLHTSLTFILGALAVLPILLYKYLWQYFPSINIVTYAKTYEDSLVGVSGLAMIPVSVIIMFLFIGVIEEVMKQSAVYAADDNRIRHIDDAIMFAILAALGFAFTENILYFYNIWSNQGPEHLLVPFLFRSVFSTFAHILFSSMFGYYYGVAHFAKPILQEELRSKRHRFWIFFHRIFRFKTAALFHEEKILEGFAIAVGLHSLYDISLEMNWTFVMVPYLVFGYLYVSHLFRMKENHKQYALLYVDERNHSLPPKQIARHVSRLVKKII